jgi:hypothetical protein
MAVIPALRRELEASLAYNGETLFQKTTNLPFKKTNIQTPKSI